MFLYLQTRKGCLTKTTCFVITMVVKLCAHVECIGIEIKNKSSRTH